jgi:ATP/ADP translocase
MKTEQALVDTHVMKTLTWIPVILVFGAVIVLVVNYIPAWKIIAVLEGFFLAVFTLFSVGLNVYLFWILFRS